MVDSVEKWETLTKLVQRRHICITESRGNILNRALTRHKDMFVKELSEHAQRTVRQDHLMSTHLITTNGHRHTIRPVLNSGHHTAMQI